MDDLKELLFHGTIPTAGAEPAIITAGLVVTILILWLVGKWAQIKPEQ